MRSLTRHNPETASKFFATNLAASIICSWQRGLLMCGASTFVHSTSCEVAILMSFVASMIISGAWLSLVTLSIFFALRTKASVALSTAFACWRSNSCSSALASGSPKVAIILALKPPIFAVAFRRSWCG